MKNILTTALVLSLAMLTTNFIIAAEREPRWRKPEWYIKACLDDNKIYSVAYSKDGKNLISKSHGAFPSPSITTKWDLATLAPITIKQDLCDDIKEICDIEEEKEESVIFDEKGNERYKDRDIYRYTREQMSDCKNAVLKAAAEVISASMPHHSDDINCSQDIKNTITAATFSSNGKQLVTAIKNNLLIIWERIAQSEQATPALESKTTE